MNGPRICLTHNRLVTSTMGRPLRCAVKPLEVICSFEGVHSPPADLRSLTVAPQQKRLRACQVGAATRLMCGDNGDHPVAAT